MIEAPRPRTAGAPVLRLVVLDTLSKETAANSRQMLGEAESGELIGTICISMYQGGEWDACASGLADRNPQLAMHMLNDYVLELSEQINGA